MKTDKLQLMARAGMSWLFLKVHGENNHISGLQIHSVSDSLQYANCMS